jgi:putative methyltransferase (TIGR04325 family)
MNASTKDFIYNWIPPAAINVIKSLFDIFRPAPYEFVSYTWPQDWCLKGWQADGVHETREKEWQTFLSSMQGNGTLGISENELLFPKYVNTNLQSLFLSYGYCLGLACHNKQNVTVLDWGGATGNYYVVSRKLIPNVSLAYHCADLSSVCYTGRKLLPEVVFDDNETWRGMKFDFVFSSSSLQYLEDWRPTVAALIQSTNKYLYITRMPFILKGKSFVIIQRAVCYGTEYLGWVLNRHEFIQFVENRGMKLIRQFVNHAGPRIKGAPEQNLYMGFLFEK